MPDCRPEAALLSYNDQPPSLSEWEWPQQCSIWTLLQSRCCMDKSSPSFRTDTVYIARTKMNKTQNIFFSFWEPQYPHWSSRNTLQDGLVWQSSAWKLSWGEALQQPGWDKAAYPQGHSNVMVCAANLLLAIQRVWISSTGGNHFDFLSLANWLLRCASTLNSVSDLGRHKDALSKGGFCQYNYLNRREDL